ncbi:hypothetical protein F9C11_33345 [Amycolatopsis sp. VS8301801F10]|uniref:hypothetical protein n=1 Tax=Amycolatopsis sp. VS8301801F10 TaxID=2652442 RepID=UPI0038FD301A
MTSAHDLTKDLLPVLQWTVGIPRRRARRRLRAHGVGPLISRAIEEKPVRLLLLEVAGPLTITPGEAGPEDRGRPAPSLASVVRSGADGRCAVTADKAGPEEIEAAPHRL